MRTETSLSTLISSGLLSTGCLAHFQPAAIDPPPPPAQTTPALRVDPGPVPDDKGRVVLDAVGRSSDVEEVLTTTDAKAYGPAGNAAGHAETTRPVCQTPCAADLPRGSHKLRFTPVDGRGDWKEEFTIDVGAKPSVYRVAPGYLHESSMGQTASVMLQALGLSAAVGGGALLTADAGTDSDAAKKYQTPGAVIAGIGAGVLVAGILLGYLTRGEKRPSAAVQWTPGQANGAGPSVAAR